MTRCRDQAVPVDRVAASPAGGGSWTPTFVALAKRQSTASPRFSATVQDLRREFRLAEV
jgi:hypothetical protein